MASTSVAGALISSPARLAGRVAGDQPPSFPRLGGGGPHRVSLLSDPGLPRRRRTGPETSRLSYGLSGEGVLVRVRTYGFPGVLRGLPGPRLATIPTSQPRRSLSSPGDVLCASSVAVGQLSSPSRGGLRHRRRVALRRPCFGAAMAVRKGRGSGPFEEPVPSGLGRLSGWRDLTPLRPRSCGSVPRRCEPSQCWSGRQRAGELLSAPCGEKLPGRARSRGPAAARACASTSSRAANALGSTYRRCHNGGYGRP